MTTSVTGILRRGFSSIRTRLLAAFVLLVLLPAAAITVSSIIVGIREGKQQAFEKLEAVAALKATEISRWLQNLQTDMLGLAEEGIYITAASFLSGEGDASNRRAAGKALLSRFQQVTELTQHYDELFLLSLQGVVVLSTDPIKTGEYRGIQPYFKEGLKKPGVHIQSVSFSSTSEKLNTVMVVHPVVDEKGRTLGVMCGQAKLRMLNTLMGERTGLGRSGETYLVGPNHVLMTVSRHEGYPPGMTALYADGVDTALDKQTSGRAYYTNYLGRAVLGVHQWLPELRAVLMAEQERDEAFAPLYTTLNLNAGVAFAAVLLAGLASILFTRSIASPLADLAKTASAIAEGNLELTAKVEAADEIGSLAETFNSMTGQLRRRIEIEKMVANVSRKFIDSPPHEVDCAIEQALEDIGRFMGVDRSYIFLFSEDVTTVSNTHEWCRDGVEAQIGRLQGLPIEAFPWFFERMKNFETVEVATVAELPQAASAEKEEWSLEGIRSLVCVPMVYRKKLRGYIGVDSVGMERPWAEEDVQLLRIAGEIICSALERKWSEKALAAQKERLAVTLRSIGDGVIVTDMEGSLILMNRVAEKLTGWTQEESAGAPLGNIFVAVDEKTRQPIPDPVSLVVEKGAVQSLPSNVLLISRDGSEHFIADSCAPVSDAESRMIGVVIVFQDITEKQLLEKDRARAEKLESIGILAGGIAHDYNNILTAILGNLSLAKLHTPGDSKVFQLLERAEKAAAVAEGLAHQLLTFSKGGEPIKQTSSVAELITDAVSFALRGSNVRSDFSFADDLLSVDIDRGQISQVLNNLAINAKQAMPDGGVFETCTENCLLVNGNQHNLPAGRYVKITLRDNGPGIPDEHLIKIFDPYFTTKTTGSGLGLATSYAIIKKHQGAIAVRSAVGVGTTFEIYLPVSEQSLPEIVMDGGVHTGTGSILVMDDDEAVIDALRDILAFLGYRAEFVRDGSDAVRRYGESLKTGSPFDLVIMDLTIPGGMGGKDAIHHLKQIDRNVKAIVSSGYSNDPVMSNFREYGFSGIAVKPYQVSELSEQIKRVLNT